MLIDMINLSYSGAMVFHLGMNKEHKDIAWLHCWKKSRTILDQAGINVF